MKPKTVRRVLVAVASLLMMSMAGGVSLNAQASLDHVGRLAAIAKALKAKLPADATKALSGGGQQLLAFAGNESRIRQAGRAQAGRAISGPAASGFANDVNTREDFASRLTGMTQNETTAGWCGSNAIIGFNDSGSFMNTAFLGPSPSGSISFDGWSRSTDGGVTYTDGGALTPDPVPAGVLFRDLFGDPVIRCTSPSTFYCASLAMDTTPAEKTFSGISVSRSTNGGASWEGAVMAVRKKITFFSGHFLDKEWMAVDPGPTSSPSDDIILVTYTDFDFTFNSAACPGDFRTAIELVRSVNGGATWSKPLAIDQQCGAPFVQGSLVATGLGSDVYVAWEHYADDFVTREIQLAKSTNGGVSFGSPSVVTPVTPAGDGFVLQGLFRDDLDLQGLAVDRSAGPFSGSVYVTYQDGGSLDQPDPFSFCKTVSFSSPHEYCFPDILFRRSANGGASWSAPARVNSDLGMAVDHFMPALDVDSSGHIWTAFYDRRRDPRNFLIDAFLAQSNDGGASWSNTRISKANFAPVHEEDIFINDVYMGDYIAVAADATGANPGVVTAWGDNSLGDANVAFKAP